MKLLKILKTVLNGFVGLPERNVEGLKQFVHAFKLQHPKIQVQYDFQKKVLILGNVPDQVIIGLSQNTTKEIDDVAASFYSFCSPPFAAMIGGLIVSFFGEVLILYGYTYRADGSICTEESADYYSEIAQQLTKSYDKFSIN